MPSHTQHQQAFWLLTTPDEVPYHICRVPKLMSSDALPPAPGQEALDGQVVKSIGSVDIFVAGLDDGPCTRVCLHDVRLMPSHGPSFLVVPKERFMIIGQEADRTDRLQIQFVDDSNRTIRCTVFKVNGSESQFAVELCHDKGCRKKGKGHVSRLEA